MNYETIFCRIAFVFIGVSLIIGDVHLYVKYYTGTDILVLVFFVNVIILPLMLITLRKSMSLTDVQKAQAGR